jgi:hypothetical protein
LICLTGDAPKRFALTQETVTVGRSLTPSDIAGFVAADHAGSWLRGLGAGLDQRATEAVRQWRFSPARRYGTPVDVIVEVAMEFKLR